MFDFVITKTAIRDLLINTFPYIGYITTLVAFMFGLQYLLFYIIDHIFDWELSPLGKQVTWVMSIVGTLLILHWLEFVKIPFVPIL